MVAHIVLVLCVLVMVSVSPAMSPATPFDLIPWPRNVKVGEGTLSLPGKLRVVAEDPTLVPLSHVLADELHRLLGVEAKADTGTAQNGDISLRLNAKLGTESYFLSVDTVASVEGANYDAVASASATLLQLLRNDNGRLSLPRCTIADEPAYAFRSVLIDLARKYHSPDGVKQVIELARLYKIRYIHLVLSDDQLFMFPSTAFSNLGKSNRELQVFEPISKPKVEPYTLAELKDLEQFAKDRGVHLVPEINFPGHAARIIADAKDPFAFPGNGSTVNIADPNVVQAVETLLNEMMDVFSSTRYVHLGADEVWMGGIEKTPQYQQLLKDEPRIKSPHDLYCRFIGQMVDVVAKRGKKAIVWEEAFSGSRSAFPIPKDVVIMAWSHGRDPNEFAAAGNPVVNATWTPLYIVRNDKKPIEFMYNWRIGQFGREGSDEYTTLDAGLQDRLIGVQLCSWENSECMEIQHLRERLALVAQRSWNPAAGGTLEQFKKELATSDAIVERLLCPVAIRVEGKLIRDESSFTDPITVSLSGAKAGLAIRYTLDNSLPGPQWKPYTAPIPIDKTVWLRAGLFDESGKQQGDLSGSWFYRTRIVGPNLATNRPVTVGPAADRTDAWQAKAAVDGRADKPGLHWASIEPAPQWLQIDLGDVKPISTVDVITYWDGNRWYAFTVDVSTDGKTWKKVVDYAENRIAATAVGYPGAFEKTEARYVRVNVLKSNGNGHAHIVEVVVN